jgi:hypothetical protein
VQASAITYGANFDLQKLLNCPALKISWRVRLVFFLFDWGEDFQSWVKTW